MVIILCNTYLDALDGFDIFIQFLEEEDSYAITKIDESSLTIFTEENIIFMFLYDRWSEIVLPRFEDPEIYYYEDFFENLI